MIEQLVKRLNKALDPVVITSEIVDETGYKPIANLFADGVKLNTYIDINMEQDMIAFQSCNLDDQFDRVLMYVIYEIYGIVPEEKI